MEGGELGGMAAGYMGGLGAISAVPLAQIAGNGGRPSPTIWNTGMGATVAPAPQGYVSTSQGAVAPPIGITTFTPSAWPTWGKWAAAVAVSGVVIYGAYKVAGWWEGR